MLPTRLTDDVVRIGDIDTHWAVFVFDERHESNRYRNYYNIAVHLTRQGWCAIVNSESESLYVYLPTEKHLSMLTLKLSGEYRYSRTIIGSVSIWVYHSYLDHLIANELVADPDKLLDN